MEIAPTIPERLNSLSTQMVLSSVALVLVTLTAVGVPGIWSIQEQIGMLAQRPYLVERLGDRWSEMKVSRTNVNSPATVGRSSLANYTLTIHANSVILFREGR